MAAQKYRHQRIKVYSSGNLTVGTQAVMQENNYNQDICSQSLNNPKKRNKAGQTATDELNQLV